VGSGTADAGRPVVLTARPGDVLEAFGPDAVAAVLAPHERRRATALRHPADRAAYVAAHLLARECAARLTGSAPRSLELAQRCADCGSAEHGRPSLSGRPDVHLSLAHSRGAVIAGAYLAPLGVDVEPPVAPGARQDLVAAVLAAAEAEAVRTASDPSRAVSRLWVRKESLVKLGLATLDTMRTVDLTRATALAPLDGRDHAVLDDVHLVDWFDEPLGAAFGVAASAAPVVAAFSAVGRADGG
jgi:4'-phosphopantetheinyl transferase